MTDTPAAPSAEQQADVGRVDVPGAVRDVIVTIRARALRLDRTLNAHWTSLEKRNAAEEELLVLAEDALSAHRLLRSLR